MSARPVWDVMWTGDEGEAEYVVYEGLDSRLGALRAKKSVESGEAGQYR